MPLILKESRLLWEDALSILTPDGRQKGDKVGIGKGEDKVTEALGGSDEGEGGDSEGFAVNQAFRPQDPEPQEVTNVPCLVYRKHKFCGYGEDATGITYRRTWNLPVPPVREKSCANRKTISNASTTNICASTSRTSCSIELAAVDDPRKSWCTRCRTATDTFIAASGSSGVRPRSRDV
jgi:hypothetical protein